MSALDELIGILRGQRDAAEWVATARTRAVARVRHGAVEERAIDERAVVGAVVHRDLPAGRGSARLAVGGGALRAAVDDAMDRAAVAIGPAWRMAPPAAPAQVETADPALAARGPAELAETIATGAFAASGADALARLAGATVVIDDVEVELVRETIDVASSSGLHVRWSTTEARVTALVSSEKRTTVARARARRLDGLGLTAALAGAAELLGARGAAGQLAGGTLPVVLRLGALAPADGGLGAWAAFAAQADATLVRRGLSRYRPGRPIALDAASGAEPITVTSDGTLPWGLASAPLGDEAEPVRRFALVEGGVAREVAYDQREAALAGALPNGGVRNVVVERGATPVAELAAGGPVLDVASLAWIEVEPRTAALSAGIELAYLRDGDTATPIVGGVIRGDAIAALARARRSSEIAMRGSYRGPIAVRTPPLDVSP